jgi:hypothetical protein
VGETVCSEVCATAYMRSGRVINPMDNFPLSPFLGILRAEGFHIGVGDYDRISKVLRTGDEWTIDRLRGVLLALIVKSPQQAELFKREFDKFFALDISRSALYSRAEMQLFLDRLRARVEPPTYDNDEANIRRVKDRKLGVRWGLLLPASYDSLKRNASSLVKRTSEFLRPVLAFAFLLTLAAVLSYAVYRLTITFFQSTPSTGGSGVSHQQSNNNNNARPGPDAPYTPPTSSVNGSDLILFLFGFFVASLLIGELFAFFGYRSGREPSSEFDPDAPRQFSTRRIGEDSISFLSQEDLDGAADAVNYFSTWHRNKHLDLKATVDATGRGGGLPQLVFERINELRCVYVFEDAYAEPLAWNRTATELTTALTLRGVQVQSGRFCGSPDKFWMLGGEVLSIEDLHQSSDNSLFLFFSDGKQLSHVHDEASLRSLSRLPFAAWLDLRDPMFWDESAAFVEHYGIPLFHSDGNGVLLALETVLSEKREVSPTIDSHVRTVYYSSMDNLYAYTEYVLGEALPWAQACAMIQPLPLGLASLLRERFQPSLPPQRIELLFRLPGTWWDASGVRFSLRILNVLRSGFASRVSLRKQEEILDYLIAQIRAVEPVEKNSLRHLSWEWAVERVRLELDPDDALGRIDRLLLTPLGERIRAEFSYVSPPGAIPAKDNRDRVPLRVLPATRGGRIILRRLAPHLKHMSPVNTGRRYDKPIDKLFDSRLTKLQAAIAGRLSRNPSLGLWRGLISILFDLLRNFPYHEGVRDIAGYHMQKRTI